MYREVFDLSNTEFFGEILGMNMEDYSTITEQEYRTDMSFKQKAVIDDPLFIEDVRISFMNFMEDKDIFIPYGQDVSSGPITANNIKEWIDPVPYFHEFMSKVNSGLSIRFSSREIFAMLDNCSIFNVCCYEKNIKISKRLPIEIPMILRHNKFLPRKYYKFISSGVIIPNNKILSCRKTIIEKPDPLLSPEHRGIVRSISYEYKLTSCKYYLEYNIFASDEYARLNHPKNPVDYFVSIKPCYEKCFPEIAKHLEEVKILETFRIHLIYIIEYCFDSSFCNEVSNENIIRQMNLYFSSPLSQKMSEIKIIKNLVMMTSGFVESSDGIYKREGNRRNDPFKLKIFDRVSGNDLTCSFRQTVPDDPKYISKCRIKSSPLLSIKDIEITAPENLMVYPISNLRKCDHNAILSTYFFVKYMNEAIYFDTVTDIYKSIIDDRKNYLDENLYIKLSVNPYLVEEQRLRLIIAMDELIPIRDIIKLDKFLELYGKIFDDGLLNNYTNHEIMFLINLSISFTCINESGVFIITHINSVPDNIFSIYKWERRIDDIPSKQGFISIKISPVLDPRKYTGYIVMTLIPVSSDKWSNYHTKDIFTQTMEEKPIVIEDNACFSSSSTTRESATSSIVLNMGPPSLEEVKEKEESIETQSEISSISCNSSVSRSLSVKSERRFPSDAEEMTSLIIDTIKTLHDELYMNAVKLTEKELFIYVITLRDLLTSKHIFGDLEDTKKSIRISTALLTISEIKKLSIPNPKRGSDTDLKSLKCYRIPIPFPW
jgi:hypothetical protein